MSKDKDELVIENAILQHAYNLLATEVPKEYALQLLEWEKYINRVVDAQIKALQNHQDVLTKILNEQQKAAQQNAAMCMFALSLIAGPALSWLSGTIQYKWYPQLRSQPKLAHTYFYVEGRKNPAKSIRMEYTADEYNKVAAKIFGDASADIIQNVGIDVFLTKGVEKITRQVDAYKKVDMPAANAAADQLDSYRTSIVNAFKDEQAATVETIGKFASKLISDSTIRQNFGAAVLAKLDREQPQLKNASLRERQEAGKKVVEEIVDKFRNHWADQWFYYGHNPPLTSTTEISRRIEREIWAMWILQQKFQIKLRAMHSTNDGITLSYYGQDAEGSDKIVFHSLIIKRLIDLGVVLPQTPKQFSELNDRNWNNFTKERPRILIKGGLDTQDELKEVEDWANNHPLEFLHGNFNSEIRMLPSIVNIH